jgi:hypothetical protein
MARLPRRDVRGAGSPNPSTVVAEEVLTPARTGVSTEAAAVGMAQSYRILVTNQTDLYDAPVSFAAAATFAAGGDNFAGTDRKAAKLAISNAKTESFSDLKDLIATLVADNKMIKHKPPIKKDAKQGRVKEEERNVRVRAFIYAASRENDNDFHLIIGRNPKASPLMCMTMEISALPPKTSNAFARLKSARDAYKNFFGSKLPGPSYHFYRPPIPIEIEGSLFFDITHATGGHPGPNDLRPHIPTIWEIHPITKIAFEP